MKRSRQVSLRRSVSASVQGVAPGVKPHSGTRSVKGRRGGLTILETVLSVALLGMVAGLLAGTVSLLRAQSERTEQLIGAHELANRLVLLHLDEGEAMPSQAAALQYGPFWYRWEMDEVEVRVRQSDAARDGESRPMPFERTRQVRVRVWATNPDAPMRPRTEQLAELTRVYDLVVNAYRTPDKLKRMQEDPMAFAQMLVEMATGGAAASGQQRGGNGNQSGGSGGAGGNGGGGR